jgi:hypothetical protein
MQIKYDINTPNFMIRKHAIFVFSNTIFGFKFEVHFEIFCKKLSYNTFIIVIMLYNIWEINFNYITCHYNKD